MSATVELIKAFETAGRAGLTRDEIAVIVGRRNVTSRVRRLEREHGFVFNKHPSKFDSRRVWRWVLVLRPGDLADEQCFERDPEPELTLFERRPARGGGLCAAGGHGVMVNEDLELKRALTPDLGGER